VTGHHEEPRHQGEHEQRALAVQAHAEQGHHEQGEAERDGVDQADAKSYTVRLSVSQPRAISRGAHSSPWSSRLHCQVAQRLVCPGREAQEGPMVSASVSRLASRVTRVVATVCVLAGAWFAATRSPGAAGLATAVKHVGCHDSGRARGNPHPVPRREIFRVRRALGPVTAVQRAETIQALLDANVRADTSPDDFNVVEFPATPRFASETW